MLKGDVISRRPSNREGVTEVVTCDGFAIKYKLCGCTELVEKNGRSPRKTLVFDTEAQAQAAIDKEYSNLPEVCIYPWMYTTWEGLPPVTEAERKRKFNATKNLRTGKW